MINIVWVKESANVDRFIISNYLFKRKQVVGVSIFEIWKAEELIFKTSDDSEFLKYVRSIFEYRIWNR